MKNSQIIDVEKKWSNLAVAKLSSEYAQAMSDEQRAMVVKRYEEAQALS
jgi:pantothenate kinase-related protein Tda10